MCLHHQHPKLMSDKYSKKEGTGKGREGLEGTERDKSISCQTILHLKVSTTAGTLTPCSCPHLSPLLCLHTVQPQLSLTFPRGPLTFTINYLIHPHNTGDQRYIHTIQTIAISVKSSLKSLCFRSESLS